MRKSFWIAAVIGLFMTGATTRADVWDVDSFSEDDGSGTDNEVVHGTVQVHDILTQAAVVDQDWYLVQTQPFSSYEAVIDGFTGDVFGGTDLDRVDSAGTVLTAGQSLAAGINRSARWQNITAASALDYLRVTGVGTCGTVCDTNDQYTFRFYETTTSIARYNNSGSQITVLLLQNPTNYTINGRVFYWNAAGAAVANQAFTIVAKALLTVVTAGVTGATSGSITITQDGRYGDLQGKAVALEPATGFSFDTPMVYRPH